MNTEAMNTIEDKEMAALEVLKLTGIDVLEAALVAKEALQCGRGRVKRARECVRLGAEEMRRRERTVTFAKAVETALEDRKRTGLRARSIVDFRYLCKRMMKMNPGLAERRMRSVTSEDCRRYLETAFGGSPSQYRKARAILSGVFSTAIRHDWCDSNPVSRVEVPEVVEKPIEPLTIEEVERLEAAAQQPEHRDMQLSLQSRMAASSEEWDSAEVIARKIVHEKSMQKELFSIFRRKGDFKRAYETKERINELDDSVRSKMQTEDLNEMSERLDNSLLKVKADQLKIENEHIMFGAVVVALTFVIFMVAFVAVWYVRHRSARNKKKAMEERELFYRNVTHQLRTPMTVVLGMVEQLKQHIPVDDIVGRESLEAARRQSDNLLDLIKKLIAASRDGELVELSDGSAQKPIVVDRRDAEPTVTGVAGSRIIRPLPVNMVVSHVVNAVYSSSIVVAEDNDDVAMLICNMLRGKGYKVNRAADGVEAMDIMREELPDMLITDIAMPRMDGLELMRKVRSDETMCCLPIVVVSARVEDQERMDGINAGAEVFLAKPFINEELLLIVNKLLEQRRRLKQMFTSSIPDAETSRQVPDADVEFFNEINRLIDNNLVSGDVSTSFLAEKLSTSVSTLNRRLKNMSGLTSTTYIRNRRMLMAKRLLETTDQTISEIEVLCGFNTSGHFSRVFKAETGLSPLDYRKQHAMG